MLAARDAEPVVRALMRRRAPRVAFGVSDAPDRLRAPTGRPPRARGWRSARRRRRPRDQLGPLRFLLDAPDVSQVRAVVAEQLGALVAHEGRADLLATLRAFVAADGNVAETAK